MVDSSEQPVTPLLVRWSAGDREALEALAPLVYEELRGLARHYIRGKAAEPGRTDLDDNYFTD